MHEVERVDWSPAERDLWRRISAHPFERADHALDFTKRLARDRGWSLDFARGAVAEYRRFCFLAFVFDTPVTPSEEVDEVWHQHLTFSRDYWERWCGQALGGPLHHDPTEGGPAQQGRYRAQYAETLARYEAYFGPPPPVYWPGTAQRFRSRPRYRIIDEDRVWLLPRLRLTGWFGRGVGALALWLATPSPAAALPLNPLDWTASPFLTLFASLAAVALLGALVLRDWLRRVGRPASDEPLDVVELAYLAGGRDRAADAVVIGLVDAGAASLGVGSGVVTIEDRGVPLPRHLEPFRGEARGSLLRSALLRELRPALETVRRKLVRASLAPSDTQLRRLTLATLALVAPVVLFGLAKMAVGLERGKPIGILVILTVATAALGLAILVSRPKRTEAGDAALDRYRRRYERAGRAPRQGGDEVLIAFALGGAVALAGTPYEAYGRAMKSTGGDGSSGCGSGGDGGGGGGCGGCGGGGGD